MTAKKTTARTRHTRKSKTTKEETTGGVDGAEKKPVEEKGPQASDENARPPMTRGRKLDATRVREIRQLLGSGKKCKEIAGLFDVHESTIDDIRCSRTWASLD